MLPSVGDFFVWGAGPRKERMREPQQISLITMESPPQTERPVEYVPPAPKQVDEYVQAVCKELTRKDGTNYCDTDFVRGLTTFMQVVVSIQTRYLNRGGHHVRSES